MAQVQLLSPTGVLHFVERGEDDIIFREFIYDNVAECVADPPNRSTVFNNFVALCDPITGKKRKEVKGWRNFHPESESVPFLYHAEKKSIVSLLSGEGKGTDALVLWLDCDREGENICFEVIDCVRPGMNRPASRGAQQIFRAKFSAVTRSDILTAMEVGYTHDRAPT